MSALSTGCATMTHLTREKKLPGVSSGTTLLVDAKQRAITNAVVGGALRVCAEPSPDALTALAASAGFSLSRAEAAALATNASLAEGAASIGLRTQSIQLMRDAMYRLCEGYLSGAIDGLAFETLQRRFQSSMVAILAIEQLTGAVRAPAVVLNGSSTQGDAEQTAAATQKAQAGRDALRTAEKDVADKQEQLKSATAARTTLETEQAELKKNEMPTEKEKARLTELGGLIENAKKAETSAATAATDAAAVKGQKEVDYKALEAARIAILGGSGTASVDGTVAVSEAQDGQVAAVAAVQAIVEASLNLEFGRELCTTILTKSTTTLPTGAGEVHKTCVGYLSETVQALANRRDTISKLTPELVKLLQAATVLMNDPNADAEKVKAAVAAVEAAEKTMNAGGQPGAGGGGAGGGGLIFRPLDRIRDR